MESAGIVGPLQSNGAREVLAPPRRDVDMKRSRSMWDPLSALVLTLSLGVSAAPAQAPHSALDIWLSGLTSLRTQFTQTIKDAQGHQTDQTSGELLVLRPGRFRWESHDDPVAGAPGSPSAAPADSGQVLIADGRNAGSMIGTCSQVTVKPVDAALSATPIMLLTGGAEVREAFTISDAGSKEGLSWLRVTPRAAQADFRQAVLGFAGGELRQMILEDKLGKWRR